MCSFEQLRVVLFIHEQLNYTPSIKKYKKQKNVLLAFHAKKKKTKTFKYTFSTRYIFVHRPLITQCIGHEHVQHPKYCAVVTLLALSFLLVCWISWNLIRGLQQGDTWCGTRNVVTRNYFEFFIFKYFHQSNYLFLWKWSVTADHPFVISQTLVPVPAL